MLKLISLNIENVQHYKTVVPFLIKESADVLCLQEIPESFIPQLQTLGYQVAFAPMCTLTKNAKNETIGVAIASKAPLSSHTAYYHRSKDTITFYDKSNPDNTLSLPYVFANITYKDQMYSFATTHMVDTGNGKENPFQIAVMDRMLTLLQAEKPHCLCGDFNMPRGFNALYEVVTKDYTDAVPLIYQSSLDKNLHRLGNKTLTEPIFEKFMVDYIFTQKEYVATDVRLVFGVSDHAAVVGHIARK
jgi:exonuclease III